MKKNKENKKDDNTLEVEDYDYNNFLHYNRFEGLSFGKSPFMFRIYDKIKEISNKGGSNLIKTLWLKNGFDEENDKFVFRHEVELHRLFLKKFIFTKTHKDEVAFCFNNLSSLWNIGVKSVRFYDLTSDEIKRISSGNLSPTGISSIYDRCDKDEKRFKFWDNFVVPFNYDDYSRLNKIDVLKNKDFEQAKKALKGFVSSVYLNLGYSKDDFFSVLDEVNKDLQKDNLTLHEYGMLKVCSSFLDNEKIANVKNPFEPNVKEILEELFIYFENSKNKEFKRISKKVIENMKG